MHILCRSFSRRLGQTIVSDAARRAPSDHLRWHAIHATTLRSRTPPSELCHRSTAGDRTGRTAERLHTKTECGDREGVTCRLQASATDASVDVDGAGVTGGEFVQLVDEFGRVVDWKSSSSRPRSVASVVVIGAASEADRPAGGDVRWATTPPPRARRLARPESLPPARRPDRQHRTPAIGSLRRARTASTRGRRPRGGGLRAAAEPLPGAASSSRRRSGSPSAEDGSPLP